MANIEKRWDVFGGITSPDDPHLVDLFKGLRRARRLERVTNLFDGLVTRFSPDKPVLPQIELKPAVVAIRRNPLHHA